MAEKPMSPEQFGASFQAFVEQLVRDRPAEDPFFVRRVREHLKADPATYTIVTDSFSVADHPNLHLAIEELVTAPGRTHALLGIAGDTMSYMSGVQMAQLVSRSAAMMHGAAATEGPVSYTNVALDGDRVLACTPLGLYLIADGDVRMALRVQRAHERFAADVRIEVLAADRATAHAWVAAIRAAMRRRNVYRGQVVSVVPTDSGLRVRFHRLPAIGRADIILPPGVLDRIERHTVRFARHADRLVAAGRHLKRGLLLHGAPGTGKTLTAMYLAGQMPDRTVLLVTARGMGLLEQACAMARTLQPATVILEDVDLIAEERTRPGQGCAPLLFELLNQMDGLADDADILFVLTTNRPDLLEPALAARPGRIDQAIEVPLPDAECRQRLLELYARGLDVRADLAAYVDRTAGASAAFIREVLRKAALFAADDGGGLTVEARHVDEALHEMLVHGGDLTKRLLGASVEPSPTN